MAKGTDNEEKLIEEEIRTGAAAGPKYKNNAELLEAINTHMKNSDMPAMEQSDLDFYIEQKAKEQNTRAEADQKKFAGVSDRLKNLFINNSAASKDLKANLPEIKTAKTEHMKRLREEAKKTAEANAKKAEKRRINAERKKAQRELERIGLERGKAALRAGGNTKVTDRDVKSPDLESGLTDARGKIMFTSVVNYMSWGSRDDRRGKGTYPGDERKKEENSRKRRHGLDKEKEKEKEVFTEGEFEPQEFEDRNIGIRLKGAKYTPEAESNGKTVLVFAGSGYGADGTLKRIMTPYLKQGYTVYQFDYRGMGESHAINEKGAEIGSKLSEKTMYQDGMAMYHHLTKELGIAPKDLVLHGYSHGGPVAAKVAVEATKEIQRETIANGKNVKKENGLGGVVMHSAMRTMYDAIVKQERWRHDEVFGISVWSVFGGAFGKAFGGSYNTEQHMKDLAKLDKDIPVHFVGGSRDKSLLFFDYLNHENTGLKAAIEKDFTHVTAELGENGHNIGCNIAEDSKYLQAIAQGREAFAAVSAAEKGSNAKAIEGGKKVLESEDKNLLI